MFSSESEERWGGRERGKEGGDRITPRAGSGALPLPSTRATFPTARVTGNTARGAVDALPPASSPRPGCHGPGPPEDGRPGGAFPNPLEGLGGSTASGDNEG